MRKIHCVIIVLCLLFSWAVTPVSAGVSIGIALPNVSIGINIPVFPELVPVPGYPVYYAPTLAANYFFYDGMYWVFLDDAWYASYWYDGPWSFVEPVSVPVYILRIPVRYYLYPPVFFRGWRPEAPPRWGRHWGHDWERHRRGWDKWNRSSVPPRAPLPVYQRQYTGDRYPRHVEQQQMLRSEHYRYQPRDKKVRQHFQPQGGIRTPAPVRPETREQPRQRAPRQQDIQQPAPRQDPSHQPEPVIREQREHRRPTYYEERPQPGVIHREQQVPRPSGVEQRSHDRGRSEEHRGQGEQRREEGQGRER